jgi:hypothetical protein
MSQTKTHYDTNGLAALLMAEKKQEYNNFKRNIDRKYALYSLLRYRSDPYKLEHYQGSNQIIVTDNNGKEIYNSDTETNEQINTFEAWFSKIILTWLIINWPNGCDL